MFSASLLSLSSKKEGHCLLIQNIQCPSHSSMTLMEISAALLILQRCF
ncbi:hypothetical protein ANACAC_00398 [Anaerostipes caccae L1-92]|uniref:Uncharacterized protein n=1 Tax=Anaerostipes caccae (strain DSM 14662 / CCUG 47493 / JCM 13470 / NCIMB 13811 / L1-92) TaxID=411490 RepID=B0MA25_ANACD|nr:hypothetical protein ANACAC_00398 [Anaerostipes caccae L1-92]